MIELAKYQNSKMDINFYFKYTNGLNKLRCQVVMTWYKGCILQPGMKELASYMPGLRAISSSKFVRLAIYREAMYVRNCGVS